MVSDSQQFVRFKFILGEEWSHLTVFAQFLQNGIGYNQYLDQNNCVYLPNEIVAGEFKLTLYGSGGDVIATTNHLTFEMEKSVLISNGQSTEISLSLYQQLINEFNELTAANQNDYNRINNRVDNIVAQSGDDITEIADARVSTFDSTAKSTLYSRLNEDFTYVMNQIALQTRWQQI
jgi:hypothetical protein